MLPSNYITTFINHIGEFNFAPEILGGHLASPTRQHLMRILRLFIHFSASKQADFSLSQGSYNQLELYALECGNEIENTQHATLDEDKVDKIRSSFKMRMKKILGDQYFQKEINDLVQFTANTIENYEIYHQYFPNSTINTWYPLMEIIKNGYLILFFDKQETLKKYNIIINTNFQAGFLAYNGKKFMKTLIDNELSIAYSLYKYLLEASKSEKKYVSLTEIYAFLAEIKIEKIDFILQLMVSEKILIKQALTQSYGIFSDENEIKNANILKLKQKHQYLLKQMSEVETEMKAFGIYEPNAIYL